MKPVVVTYAKRLLVVTLLTGLLSLGLYFILPDLWFTHTLPFLLAFFYSCSLISFMILSRSLEKKFSRFVSVFMLATGVKLFLFISIMIAYSFINRKDAVPFLLNFFILYLVFTIYEVTQILGLTKSRGSA